MPTLKVQDWNIFGRPDFTHHIHITDADLESGKSLFDLAVAAGVTVTPRGYCGLVCAVVDDNDKKNGRYGKYWPNGVAYILATYRDDKLHGERTVYFAKDCIAKTAQYKNDCLDGLVTSYNRTTGRLVFSANYKGGKLHGEYKQFWPTGRLQRRGCYEYGLKHGVWQYEPICPDGYNTELWDKGNMAAKLTGQCLKQAKQLRATPHAIIRMRPPYALTDKTR